MKYIVSCSISIAAGNQMFQSGYQELHEGRLITPSSTPILDEFIPSFAQ